MNIYLLIFFYVLKLLATFSNFGGTWPRVFVLEAVDYFTDATCSINNTTSDQFLSIGKFLLNM